MLLGSNLEKERNIPAAVELLYENCEIVALSSVYETIPIGGSQNDPQFFNVAALLGTPLSITDFKYRVLLEIESKLGRQRKTDKNLPRTIDLDIILFNDEVFDYEHRHIPDPDLQKFAHVAVPVAEISPNLLHPETGIAMLEIADELVREFSRRNPELTPVRKRVDIQIFASGRSVTRKITKKK